MTATRSILALSAGIALVTLLSGVRHGSEHRRIDPLIHAPVHPRSAEEVEIDAAWLNGGTMIGLVSYGSSTCVPTADTVELLDDGTLVGRPSAEPEADTALHDGLRPARHARRRARRRRRRRRIFRSR